MALKDRKAIEKNDGSKNEISKRFKSHPLIFVGTVIVLVIVIVAFVFVPAMTGVGGGGAGGAAFGYYNKTPITYAADNYFYNWQQAIARYYQSSINDSNYEFLRYQIWLQAFNEAAIHAGKLDEMAKARYLAPDSKIDKEVAAMPRYQENGRFSVNRYRRESNNTKINVRQLAKETLTADIYTLDMNSLKPSTAESAFITAMAYPQRNFEMVSFNISTYPDSEIIAFAEENPDLFKVCSLSRITVYSGEREARQILASIEKGEMSFEDAARASSQDFDAERGGEMGSRMAYELEYIIPAESDRAAVANLSQGGISDVIMVGERSWAFFRSDEDPRPADLEDSSVMAKIRSYIFTYERGRAEDWLIDRANEFVAVVNESGFSFAVLSSSLQRQSFGPLPLNYGDLDMFPSLATSGISELQNAGRNELFWRAAFSTPLGTPSAPVVAGDSVMVVYPIEEVESDLGTADYLGSYFESVLSRYGDDAVREYFLNNSKLDNRFAEVYNGLWSF